MVIGLAFEGAFERGHEVMNVHSMGKGSDRYSLKGGRVDWEQRCPVGRVGGELAGNKKFGVSDC